MNRCLATVSTQLWIASGIAFLFVTVSCTQHRETPKEYVQKINHWHQQRIQSLKEEGSWLSLIGLYWLDEGVSTFGSDLDNDIVFPKESVPGNMGQFNRVDEKIQISVNPEVKVTIDGTPVRDTILNTDAGGNPSILQYQSLQWYLIERGDRIGIRLKDSENPELASFEGIERYPITAKWRVEARYLTFDKPKTILIPDILGDVSEEPLYGTLEFELNGNTYRLDPLGKPDDDELFVIFGDETNGSETYGAGRFVYVEKPGEDGITFIDFNKSYNPPCVFNDFATCPLPPAQNKLPVSITAGEKSYESGVH